MRKGAIGGVLVDETTGAARVHGLLRQDELYQARWRTRVATHFETPGGAFSIDASSGAHAATLRFDRAVADFSQAIDCEWARWGDAGAGNYSTATWQVNTTDLSPQFETRRPVFLSRLRDRNLAD